jgi:Tol biopolymer transport system component
LLLPYLAHRNSIIGDWIYFSIGVGLLNHPLGTGIFKLRTDGSDLTRINSSRAHEMLVADGWIYYTDWSHRETLSHLYKMRLDGSEVTLLNDIMAREIYVFEDWIYFTETGEDREDREDGENRGLYRLRLDGSEKELLTSNYLAINIRVRGDWLYFIKDGHDWEYYKMRLDGSEYQEISIEEFF